MPLDAPVMPAELVRAVAERAHQKGVKVVAHVDSAAHALRAVRAGVDALMHSPHLGGLTANEAQELKAAGIVISPTLVVYDRAEQLLESRFVPTDV